MRYVVFDVVVLFLAVVSAIWASAAATRQLNRQATQEVKGDHDVQPAPCSRISIGRMLLGLVVIGSMFFLQAVLLGMVGNFFALVNVTYVTAVCALPVYCLLVLVAMLRHRLRQPLLAAICVVGLVPAYVGVYATFVEPYWLVLETVDVDVPATRSGGEPVKVGVLADLQMDRVADHEWSAVRRLMACEPDIILIPGDFFQGTHRMFEEALPELQALLRELHAPGGVYAVLGNVDHPRHLPRAVAGTHVHLLVNEIVKVPIADREITIGGIEFDYTAQAARDTIRRLEDAPATDDIRILMAHTPDALKELSSGSRIDLTVCGHTHGGQVVLPGLGPPLTASRVPRWVAAGGLSVLDGRRVYVSRGVGCERTYAPTVRLFCKPEITLLTIMNPWQR